MRRVIACLVLLSTSELLAEFPSRKELTERPGFAEKSVTPRYEEMTPETLRDAIVVTSSRSYAASGYNTPGVRVYLPKKDNSIAALVEFGDARLVDSKSKDVLFEPELGIFDFDRFSNEVRFRKRGSGEIPLEYARATGSAKVKYPVKMATVVMAKGSKPSNGLKVKIDGPFVTWVSERAPAEMSSFSPLTSIRAYDKGGRELARVDDRNVTTEGDETRTTMAWRGEVAAVHFDFVERWVEISLSYDLPPAPKWPKGKEGLVQTAGPLTAGLAGRVEKKVVDAPSAERGADAAQGDSKAVERLRDYDITTFTEQALFVAAMEGHAEAVTLLLEVGVPLNARGGGGSIKTPAIVAAATAGYVHIVKLLAEKGADVSAADEVQRTALYEVVKYCDETALVKLLIRKGANVNVKTSGGTSILQNATWAKCAENIQALKAAGAK